MTNEYKIVVVGESVWSCDLARGLKAQHLIDVPNNPSEFDFIFIYDGVSKVKDITDNMYGIHPAPLPYYTGPDPMGTQLKAGVDLSVVSVYKLTSIRYQGTVVATEPYSLSGLHPRDNAMYAASKAIKRWLYIKPEATKTEVFDPQYHGDIAYYQANDIPLLLWQRYLVFHGFKPNTFYMWVGGETVLVEFDQQPQKQVVANETYNVKVVHPDNITFKTCGYDLVITYITPEGGERVTVKEYLKYLKSKDIDA